MIHITRRRILIVVLAFVLFGIGTIAWTLAGLPPVRFILRYGLSPGCEPTGETMTLEGVEFVEIGPGIFRMGSDYLAEGGDWLGKICAPFGLPWGERPKASIEMPVHWVEFRRGFWIARTEVTNAQYERFDQGYERDDLSKGDDHPAVNVSWEDARRYCKWLAARAGRTVRLPSESEWECACRAGSDRKFSFGEDAADLREHAWYFENSDLRAKEVGTKRPNSWGLVDMHGNVWEWCMDLWQPSYRGAPSDGSAWTTELGLGRDPERVCRGGGHSDYARACRSASRDTGPPDWRIYEIGFRPAFRTSDD